MEQRCEKCESSTWAPTNQVRPFSERLWEGFVHISHRHTNLALLQSYGNNAWKINNYLLENSATRLEKAVEELKERTVQVNRERKNAQVKYPHVKAYLKMLTLHYSQSQEHSLRLWRLVGLSSSPTSFKLNSQTLPWKPRLPSWPNENKNCLKSNFLSLLAAKPILVPTWCGTAVWIGQG